MADPGAGPGRGEGGRVRVRSAMGLSRAGGRGLQLLPTHLSLGEIGEAVNIFEKWLEEEPNDPIARHMLAACTGRDVPERASNGFVETTFDSFASSFESKLTPSSRCKKKALRRRLTISASTFLMLLAPRWILYRVTKGRQ